MRRMWIAVAAVVLFAGSALAQGKLKPWDPATVETFKGTITRERDVGRLDVHVIVVKADGGNRIAVLGPKNRLDPGLVALEPPAEVDVTASKQKTDAGRELFLASLVKAGGKEYRVRDDQGRPLDKDGKPVKR